ncbi:MAG: 4-hydroxy-tetrahydrodipicolinate reductase [Elusimicrobiota bacterium]|jgi:4-hydroxy-tetrahydrodipicolinate reductase|nr:4-hydroxy-tetrahydrodipicolinate reductase [Elusimicrobiota bacterium]
MKIIVCGAAGRMGQAILNLAKTDIDIEVVGAVEFDKSPFIGSPSLSGIPIIGSDSLKKVLPLADVMIDFTSCQSALTNLEAAKTHKKPVVIGTTGFDTLQKNQITQIAQEIPVLLSPNMSMGVNVLFKLVEEAAKKLSGYDIEILEVHHNKKKDAPSGTAVKIAEIAAKAVGKDIGQVGVYGRHSAEKVRTKEEIGIMSLRGGDIAGDHTVYFAGIGDRVEITHRASSRDAFAAGALKAARWIIAKTPNLYSMQDVLELN